MTRTDHLAVGSTPPIDPKFGDNVPQGDTLTDEELGARYVRDLDGIRQILSLPKNQQELLSGFLEGFPSDLEYYQRRGIDISEGQKIIGIDPTLSQS